MPVSRLVALHIIQKYLKLKNSKTSIAHTLAIQRDVVRHNLEILQNNLKYLPRSLEWLKLEVQEKLQYSQYRHPYSQQAVDEFARCLGQVSEAESWESLLSVTFQSSSSTKPVRLIEEYVKVLRPRDVCNQELLNLKFNSFESFIASVHTILTNDLSDFRESTQFSSAKEKSVYMILDAMGLKQLEKLIQTDFTMDSAAQLAVTKLERVCDLANKLLRLSPAARKSYPCSIAEAKECLRVIFVEHRQLCNYSFQRFVKQQQASEILLSKD